MFGHCCLWRMLLAVQDEAMFGQHIVDRDRQRLIADLDYLRMEEPTRTPKERSFPWRMLRVQTGGIEHVGAPLGRLASLS